MKDHHAVFLSELRVHGESYHWRWVRWELFIFRDVLDVLPTTDRNRVMIVHRGLAQPERWRQALVDAGHNPSSLSAP